MNITRVQESERRLAQAGREGSNAGVHKIETTHTQEEAKAAENLLMDTAEGKK